MRSPTRKKQKVWYSKITEKQVGIDTIELYDKPTMKRLVVSATAGDSLEIGAGIVPNYDRVITVYNKPLPEVKESYALWIDVKPVLDDNGYILLENDGYTPVTPPDYTLKRILGTEKGTVFRYGISKIGGNR